MSALLVPATLVGLYQFADEQISPKLRLLWGAGHGAAHVVAALTCLIFVEFAAEWSADVGLVSVDAGDNTTLATSMYEGYEANFAGVLDGLMSRVDDAAAAAAEAAADAGDAAPAARFFRLYLSRFLHLLSAAGLYAFGRFPLIRTIYEVFDLPSLIATKHASMCTALCAGGSCMGTKDALLFAGIDRYTMVTYTASIAMYFIVIAIPCAGGIFGSWLALTLNAFKSQYNEGFSR